MEIEGHCQDCDSFFDAHWNKGVRIMDPRCPVCKSRDINMWSDESLEYEPVEIDSEGEDD